MYEYKVIRVSNDRQAENQMNLMAIDGWRCIQTMYVYTWVKQIFITFERLKQMA